MMQTKVLAGYLVLTGIAMAAVIAVYSANPVYGYAAEVLLIPAWWFTERGARRCEGIWIERGLP